MDLEEIMDRGPTCWILLQKDNSDDKRKALKKIYDRGVNIRYYPDNEKVGDLRGRLIKNADGTKACIFEKVQQSFRIISIASTSLLELVYNHHSLLCDKGTHPFIDTVIFDVDGALFDGGIEAFLKR